VNSSAKCFFAIAMLVVAPTARARSLLGDVTFPGIGTVSVRAEGPQISAGSRGAITMIHAHQEIARFPFKLGATFTEEQLRQAPFPVRFLAVEIAGIEGPLVVAVAGLHGGSDGSYETMVLGAGDGEIRELVIPRPETNNLDAVCLAYVGESKKPTLLVAHFLWEREIHYAPHRYRVQVFPWSGETFDTSDQGTETSAKHVTAASAFKEFGYRCHGDFVFKLIPDER